MSVEQVRWSPAGGWESRPALKVRDPQFVLVFADDGALGPDGPLEDLRQAWPGARIVGCSAAGEVQGPRVFDGSLVATAVRFRDARVEMGMVPIETDSREAGRKLAASVPHEGLRHALVFAEGLAVDGTEFAHGMREALPAGITVTGGFAGDAFRYRHTLAVWEGTARGGVAIVVGFYGAGLRIGWGCEGGWGAFGPERLITRSRGRVLHEMDNQPVLPLYKKYLGEHATGLPLTGLMFPLLLRMPGGAAGVGRAVLDIDEEEQSVTFAGNVPQGAYARLMIASHERLVEGAGESARAACESLGLEPELAVAISCAARKIVLADRVDEEVEDVRHALGPAAALTGFYSYGEIAPLATGPGLELQNQTMVVTTFAEAA
jgi:hypothetical protein